MGDVWQIYIRYEPTLHWAHTPGTFVNKLTGIPVGYSGLTPSFLGTIDEWNETLVEVLNDLCRTMGLGYNCRMRVRCSSDVFRMFERSIAYRFEASTGASLINGVFELIVDDRQERGEVLLERHDSEECGCVRIIDL